MAPAGFLTIRDLTERDIPSMIALHQECFPNYFSTKAGPIYLKMLYETFITANGCLALGGFAGEELAGLAVGHRDRYRFLRMLVLRHGIRLVATMAPRLLLSRVFRQASHKRRDLVWSLIRLRFTGEEGSPSENLSPNRLVSLAVKASFRRSGVAKLVVDAFCQRMLEVGAGSVGLSVLKVNEAAIAFYERTGWCRESETSDAVYYRRELSEEGHHKELEEVRQRYARRQSRADNALYSPLAWHSRMVIQERERALVRWIKQCGIDPVEKRRVLEIGCGNGNFLLDLIRLGFDPAGLVGIELLEDRAAAARRCLPPAVRIIVGDASTVRLPDEGYDVVLQSTVFTSLLDKEFRQMLASRMWALTKPGGGILWYDFRYNNPKNPDVRGIPVREVYRLFSGGNIQIWKVTLAPPIARLVTRIHPNLYHVFNCLPFLRTHILCWINKPA